MSKHSIALACLISLSMSCTADATDSASYSACMEQSNSVTSNMLDCIAAELQTQDARLNSAYRTLQAQLSSERKQELTAAQRLWIQYRDANCGFYADPEGGTFATLASNQCVLDETTQRAEELETLGAVH
ncbi:lysozyme inhibitor LprI family protein [Luteimonas sp. A277]